MFPRRVPRPGDPDYNQYSLPTDSSQQAPVSPPPVGGGMSAAPKITGPMPTMATQKPNFTMPPPTPPPAPPPPPKPGPSIPPPPGDDQTFSWRTPNGPVDPSQLPTSGVNMPPSDPSTPNPPSGPPQPDAQTRGVQGPNLPITKRLESLQQAGPSDPGVLRKILAGVAVGGAGLASSHWRTRPSGAELGQISQNVNNLLQPGQAGYGPGSYNQQVARLTGAATEEQRAEALKNQDMSRQLQLEQIRASQSYRDQLLKDREAQEADRKANYESQAQARLKGAEEITPFSPPKPPGYYSETFTQNGKTYGVPSQETVEDRKKTETLAGPTADYAETALGVPKGSKLTPQDARDIRSKFAQYQSQQNKPQDMSVMEAQAITDSQSSDPQVASKAKAILATIAAQKQAGQRAPAEPGTWSIQEDSSGKPVQYNSKTGEVRPVNGVQKSGTAQKASAAEEKAMGPIQATLDYVNNPARVQTPTGPSDEALMEKYFDLAKPSTGFRMTKQQMDMLQSARSWMGSAEAKIRHATSGTWFSDTQRKQIIQTMNDLGQAKIKSHKQFQSPTSQSQGGVGVTVWTRDARGKPIPQQAGQQ